jgi:hypothetical protein
MLDPTTLPGTDIFSTTIGGLGYDMGGRRAVKTSDLDYYKNLAAKASEAGLGNYGIGALSGPLGELQSFSSKSWMPGATFAGADGKAQHYIPSELVTKMWGDKETGNMHWLYDFLGNEDILKQGKLTQLGDQYASQLANTSWYGTDYDLKNAGLGYVLDEDTYKQLALTKGPWFADNLDGGSQGASRVVYEPASEYSDEKFPWMHSSGASSVFSGDAIRRMTPEVRSYLLNNLESYGDRTGNAWYPGAKHTDANWGNPAYSPWAREISDALWYIQDAQDPANFAFHRGGEKGWTPDPYVWTPSGIGQLGGEATVQAQHAASFNEGSMFDNLFQGAIMAAVTGGAFGALGGSGIFGGLLDGFGGESLVGDALASSADIITGGLADTGLSASQIASMGTVGTEAGLTGIGAIDSALSAAGDYLTNPATLERAALNAGQQLLTTGDVDPEKILLNTGMGAVGAAAGNLTSGLTDIPLLDKAIATAGTGVVFGQDPTQALLNAGIGAAGSLAGSTVGGMDIGGAGSLTDKYLPGLASVLTGTALRGGDLESAVTNYIVSTGVQAGSAELKNIVKDILPAVEAQLTSSAAVDPSVMGFEDGYATDGAVSEAADAGAGTEPTTEEPTTEAPTTEEPTTDGETQLTPEEVDAELQRVLEENPNVYTPPTQAEIDAWVAGDATWVDKAVNQVVNYASSQLKKALSPAAVKSFLTAQFAPTPRTTATPQGAVSDATDSTFSGSAPRKKEEGDEMSDAQIAELAAKMGVTPSEVKIILAQSRKKA